LLVTLIFIMLRAVGIALASRRVLCGSWEALPSLWTLVP